MNLQSRLVKPIIGKTITQIMQENDIQRAMPEDLERLSSQGLGITKTFEYPQ